MLTDAERDLRSGDQWILSVLGYLRWRTGDDWRRLHLATERWNETRWYYLHAFKLLNDLRFANPPACQCTKFCFLPAKRPVRSVRLPIRKARASASP
jgi:hypothetical protein